MARITRKELKTDKFALEVEHTFTFFEEHRRDAIRYGAAALAVLVLVSGIYFWQKSRHAAREEALAQAMQAQEAQVGSNTSGALAFPTEQAKNQEVAKRFAEVVAKYPGSDEALIAEFSLGSLAVDEGRLAEAEKRYKNVADAGNKYYSPLAKMALAQIYFGDGRTSQGEEVLRGLTEKSSPFVSKDEATIALARGLAHTKPAEARKLLDPLRSSRESAISQAAIQAYSEIPQ